MAFEGAIRAVERLEWLDQIGKTLQQIVNNTLEAAGQPVQDFLHGTWLGHPLHPVLTDVPLGSWTAALVLDALDTLTDHEELGAGADVAIALGLVGAAGSAVTGLADWRYTQAETQRVGVAHALLNVSATLLYSTALLVRQRGSRPAGRGLASLGYAAAMVAAYLGGDLVYRLRVGMDHSTAEGALPSDFTPVLPLSQLPESTPHRAEVNGVAIVLVRRGERIYALADACAHLGGPLSEGKLADGSIICPWHGSRFALADGRVLNGPSAFSQPRLEARVRDGQVEVRAATG